MSEIGNKPEQEETPRRGNPAWVKGGPSPNPSGTSKDVRELHALVRTGIPRAFEKALKFLESDDPQTAKIGMDWIGKYGLPVPQMKSSDKTDAAAGLGLDAGKLKELLAALRTH